MLGSKRKHKRLLRFIIALIATAVATLVLMGDIKVRIPTSINELCETHGLLCSLQTACNRHSFRCRFGVSSDSSIQRVVGEWKPAVLYYNRHGGCRTNLFAALEKLGLSSKMATFDPSQLSGYGMSHARAQQLIQRGHVQFVCNKYDVVIVADTIPHARALLLSLLETDTRVQCQSKIVLEITNRFDWQVKDVDAYYWMMRALVEATESRLKGRLFWVANNAFDKAYIEARLGVKMPFIRLIRPMGVATKSQYPWDLPKPSLSNFAAQKHYSEIYSGLSKNYSIPITVFPFGHKYGGPQHLLRFKAFIDVPYQYSTMKFYENIAHGVPMLIPTPRFLDELFNTGIHTMLDTNTLKDLHRQLQQPVNAIPGFPEWSAYMDYYDPLFAPLVYYVDSFKEFQEMADKSWNELDSRNVRQKGPEFYGAYRRLIVQEWLQLFRDMWPAAVFHSV
ncbi:hypothetical protein HDU77_007405 [Chytriomyces hyalinus]|nr:hypothetical protein HDU77_007405 [Chytriomyces hyalinus]